MRLILSFFAIAILALGVLTACNSAEWKNTRALRRLRRQRATGGRDAPVPTVYAALRSLNSRRLLARMRRWLLTCATEASYNQGHIRGSKLIPEAEVVNRIDELPKNKLIVTYCS